MIYAALFVMVGVLLIGVELKLVPGFGLIGILGFATAFYGGWLAVGHDGPTGVLVSVGAAFFAVILLIVAVRSRVARRLVLRGATVGQPSSLPDQQSTLVGQTGQAATDLKPAGVGRFEGRRMDVVSENAAFIDAGTPIVIVRVAQNSIIVRKHISVVTEGDS